MATLLDSDGVIAMLAQLYQLTIRDALAGNAEERDWLAICCPDWRERMEKNGIKRQHFERPSQRIG